MYLLYHAASRKVDPLENITVAEKMPLEPTPGHVGGNDGNNGAPPEQPVKSVECEDDFVTQPKYDSSWWCG